MAVLSLLIRQYPDINLVLKTRSEDFDASFNKPNTLFLAQARHKHCVCFSDIDLEIKTKYFEKGLFVVYDFLNQAESSDINNSDNGYWDTLITSQGYILI